MRVIIAGSRHCHDRKLVEDAIKESGFDITEIVSGHAQGIDTIGEQIAKDRSIPLRIFPADWTSFGRAAGVIRNMQMATNADALIAIIAPWSKGTRNMIQQAKHFDLLVYVKEV